MSASLSHLGDESYTQYLAGSKFQFAIPSGVTINGVKVSISKSSDTSDISDVTASLCTNVTDPEANTIGNNLKKAGQWSSSGMQQYIYGGPTNLWGTTNLTTAAINSARFGFILQGYAEGEADALVSAMQITVYYTSQSISTFEYREAEIQDFQPIGADNHEFNGCKMTSPDFNIDSNDTIDGGPVAEIIEANPNQVVVTGGPTPTRSPSTGGGGTLNPQRSAPNRNLGEETLTRSSNRNDGGNQSSNGGGLKIR